MKVFLFRHGETMQSLNALEYGAAEHTAEILPEAVPVVRKMAEFLTNQKINAWFVSEYLRCQQTAKIIAETTKVDFTTTPLLNEFVSGQFEDLNNRAQRFVDLILQNQFDVAVCTHGAVIAALSQLLMHEKFTSDKLFDYPPCGVLWEIEDKTVTAFDFRTID